MYQTLRDIAMNAILYNYKSIKKRSYVLYCLILLSQPFCNPSGSFFTKIQPRIIWIIASNIRHRHYVNTVVESTIAIGNLKIIVNSNYLQEVWGE